MRNRKVRVLSAAIVALGLVASAGADVIVNDDLENGKSALGSLEASWTGTLNTGGVLSGSNSMEAVNTGYFHGDFDAVTLSNVNDAVSVTFQTKVLGGNADSNAYRYGMMNSVDGGGFEAILATQDGTKPSWFWAITGTQINNFNNANIGSFGNVGLSLGQLRTFKMTIERISDTQISVTHYRDPGTETETSMSITRTTSNFTFDRLGWQKNKNGSLYVDNVQVEFVPEPATMGLLALGGLVAIRRRR